MITVFTMAKAFIGHIGVIQRNALESWKVLHPDAEVILFGDEEGAAEAARELGIRHVLEVERKEGGPKVRRSFFDAAQRMARHELICYVNCDIALPRDFLHVVNAVDAVHGRFLMVGKRWNVNVEAPLLFVERQCERELTDRALKAWQQSSGD